MDTSRKRYETNVLSLFNSAATKELIKQKNDNGLRRAGKTYRFALKINEKESKRKNYQPQHLCNFPSFHLIQLSPGTRVPMTMGDAVVGQSLEWGNMTNYTQQSRTRKKSAPPLSQELLKVLQSRWKKESGLGTKPLFDWKESKLPIQKHGLVWWHWWRWWQCGNLQHARVGHHHFWSKMLSTITLKLLFVLWNRMQYRIIHTNTIAHEYEHQ